jgi:hypothetical protein
MLGEHEKNTQLQIGMQTANGKNGRIDPLTAHQAFANVVVFYPGDEISPDFLPAPQAD